ncbi:MAG: SDR family oxidoreductase, partial [Pseudomonadota bacterium]
MNKTDFKGSTVLITGASSGIGAAFARNLASRGANMILTARSQDTLMRIADELKRKYPISIQVFPADLGDMEAPQQLFEKVRASGISVDVLINNAGFGKWAHFLDEEFDTYRRMLSLNVNALVHLTHLFLPHMLARGTGGVINVASTAAFQPVPYIAVYSASKSFVLNFTEALSGEYSGKGLRFLALCPGNTTTNFMAVA